MTLTEKVFLSEDGEQFCYLISEGHPDKDLCVAHACERIATYVVRLPNEMGEAHTRWVQYCDQCTKLVSEVGSHPWKPAIPIDEFEEQVMLLKQGVVTPLGAEILIAPRPKPVEKPQKERSSMINAEVIMKGVILHADGDKLPKHAVRDAFQSAIDYYIDHVENEEAALLGNLVNFHPVTVRGTTDDK